MYPLVRLQSAMMELLACLKLIVEHVRIMVGMQFGISNGL